MEQPQSRTFVFYSGKIEAKAIKEGDKTRYFVKGYVSTEDLDLVNDIVTKACRKDIDTQFQDRNIKLDFEHETLRKGKDEDEMDMRIALTKSPLGKRLKTSVDEKGNIVEFELNPAWKKYDAKGNIVKTFQDVWGEIKNGFLDAFSIAYVPIRTQTKNINGIMARLLDKINIVNVALTGNPVNPKASMISAFTKSLQYLEAEEGKMDKKSYEKDGAHAHTEEGPLGEHNHPEIESAIDGMRREFYDFQNRYWDRIGKLESRLPASDDKKEAVMGKSAGEKMPEGTEEKSRLDILEKSMTALTAGLQEMQKDMKSLLAAKAEKEGSKEDDEEDEKEDKKESKKEEKSLKEVVASLQKDNAEMKAILEKAQFKSVGAPAKQQANGSGVEAKSIGPLDYL